MKKSMIFVSLLCVSQICVTSVSAQNSFYGHDRTWNNMKTVGGSCVSSDYLVPTGGGPISRSSAPFGTYQSRTPASGAPVDPRILQQQRRLQALQQAQIRQQQYYQQQMQMRQQQQFAAPQGSYYQPGGNTGASTGMTYGSGGAASYGTVSTVQYKPQQQQQPRTQGK